MTDIPKRLILDESVEADEYIGVARKTRANWRVQGIGPRFVKVGGKKVAYHPDDIVAWINSRRVQSTSEKEVA